MGVSEIEFGTLCVKSVDFDCELWPLMVHRRGKPYSTDSFFTTSQENPFLGKLTAVSANVLANLQDQTYIKVKII